ncbi:MAG: hypothetical protein DMD89_05505 [Candidatus Rokuibacteriota bacterium]|nr:MAG: hypothetical protein DMD89_05505 [Candidatus Rokubacteria bacterium]
MAQEGRDDAGRRPSYPEPRGTLKEDVDLESRRRAVGARQAGRHPVDAAQRGAAQGVAAQAEFTAGRPGHAGALPIAVREARARLHAHRLLRRSRLHRGHQGISCPPCRSMHLQVAPLDARFPQLVRWSDPCYARDAIAGACAASEVARDQLPASHYAVTLVRYRPAKRHVLRYDPLETPERGTMFAKLYPSEKGERVHRVATQVAEWLGDHREGMTSVRPLAYVAEDAVVLYPRVVGAPLCDYLRRPGPGVARCLERAGAALHALHSLPQAVAGPLPVHDFAAEIREVARDSAHVPALLPTIGAAIGALLDRAQAVRERLPQEPPTFTHRDFKCEHLLVAPGRLTLIDFDRCALADPAYDIGKFLADLQSWFFVYNQQGLEQAQERFLAGYAPGAPTERLLRARLYEAVQLVQMTVLRARLFEHHAAYRIERLIGRAQAVMNNLQSVLDLTRSLVNRKQPAAISG